MARSFLVSIMYAGTSAIACDAVLCFLPHYFVSVAPPSSSAIRHACVPSQGFLSARKKRKKRDGRCQIKEKHSGFLMIRTPLSVPKEQMTFKMKSDAGLSLCSMSRKAKTNQHSNQKPVLEKN